MEQYVATHVQKTNRMYYRDSIATPQEAVQRLQNVAVKLRQKYLDNEGKASFERDVDRVWQQNLIRILTAKNVSANTVLLRRVSRIFKLPPGNIDKYFKKRKLEYIVDKGDDYELGLERCATCNKKTKMIGGACILDSHKTLAAQIKDKKKEQQKLIEAAKKKRRKVTCKCGCWAILRPGEHLPCKEERMSNNKIVLTPISDMSADAVTSAGIAGRCTRRAGHSAVALTALQIKNGFCDICAGIAGIKCSGEVGDDGRNKDHCTCIDGPYVLTHCKRHRFAPGRPKIEEGETLCNGCKADVKRWSKLGHLRRKAKRKKEDHWLRKQLPKFQVIAMEKMFHKIALKDLKPEGVTSALQDLHASHCFLYGAVEFHNLWKLYNNRIKRKRKKSNPRSVAM